MQSDSFDGLQPAVNLVLQVCYWCQVLPQATRSSKQPAPPRPASTTEASQRLSSGVRSPAVVESHVTPRLTSTSSVPPCNNNNVIYNNSIETNDWTDDEWDDDDDDEEMPVSLAFSLLLFPAGFWHAFSLAVLSPSWSVRDWIFQLSVISSFHHVMQ